MVSDLEGLIKALLRNYKIEPHLFCSFDMQCARVIRLMVLEINLFKVYWKSWTFF